MVTTALDYWESDYAVGRRHVDFTGRNSTPDVGAMNDRDAQMYWRVIRGGFIIHREHKILDFQWLGLDADEVRGQAWDRAGNKGSWVTYTFSVTANEDADWVRYVDTSGNDTTGDGSEGNPWATGAKAVTEAQAALTSGQVGVIFFSDDQTHSFSGTAFTGSNSTSCLLRFVRQGDGTDRPVFSFPTNTTAFTVGKRGVCHIDGCDVKSPTLATVSGDAFALNRSGGVAADQDPWNFMAVDCAVDGFNRTLFCNNGLTAADRDEACNSFVALQNVTFSRTRTYYVYGLFYTDRVLWAGCTFATHTGSNTNEFTRTWGLGRTFIRDTTFTITATDSTTRWLVAQAAGDDTYAMRYVTFARCTWIGASGSTTNRFAIDTSQTSDGIMHDVRLVDCGFFGALTTITTSDGYGVSTTRFDMLECFSVHRMALSLFPSSTSLFTSVRLRNFTASQPQAGQGTFLIVSGAAARYASGCFAVVGCTAYTGALAPSDLMAFYNAEGMTRADFASKIAESDRNRFVKNSAHTPNWVRNLTDGNQTIATWQANTAHDDNSTVNVSTAANFVNDGLTMLDGDLRLASDSGPLAGTGYPLPLGVSIDADGYLRSATTPDAGPYEYGASTLPEDPELSSPSTGGQVRTSLSVGLTLGL